MFFIDLVWFRESSGHEGVYHWLLWGPIMGWGLLDWLALTILNSRMHGTKSSLCFASYCAEAKIFHQISPNCWWKKYLPYQLVQDFFHQPYVQATQKVQSGDCSASIGSTAVASSVGHPSHKKCAHVCQMSLHGTLPANIRHTPSCHLIGSAFAVELHLICLLLLAFFTFFEPRLKRLYEFAWAIKWIAPSKPAANTLPGSFVKN